MHELFSTPTLCLGGGWVSGKRQTPGPWEKVGLPAGSWVSACPYDRGCALSYTFLSLFPSTWL